LKIGAAFENKTIWMRRENKTQGEAEEAEEVEETEAHD
jgi:hypothetical protein